MCAVPPLSGIPTPDSPDLKSLEKCTRYPGEQMALRIAQPLVFVSMVTRDSGACLQRTLESILGQTHRNLHLAVVDLGSEDSTPAILRSAAARDPRVHPLSVVSTDSAEGRNHALRHLPEGARYLMSWESGDVAVPEKVARLVASLEGGAGLDLVGCQVRYAAGGALSLPCAPDAIDHTAHHGECVIHGAALYRRAVLERLGGYRTGFCGVEGHDLLARALQSGCRAANLEHCLHTVGEQATFGREASERSRLQARIGERLRVTLPWRLAHRQGRSAGIRVHLGCGEQYLEGYVNVDLDAGHHTVQERHRRDLLEDIRGLVLPPASCRELRAHHVFEHFPRAEALRLLMEWHGWLAEGGVLLLETPDLEHSLPSLLPGRSALERSRVLRHLFGSQEAAWALHMDAYDEARFRRVLGAIGFAVEGVGHTRCHGLANIRVLATRMPRRREEQMAAAEALLDEAMVDDSVTERRLRAVWEQQLIGSVPRATCRAAS